MRQTWSGISTYPSLSRIIVISSFTRAHHPHTVNNPQQQQPKTTSPTSPRWIYPQTTTTTSATGRIPYPTSPQREYIQSTSPSCFSYREVRESNIDRIPCHNGFGNSSPFAQLATVQDDGNTIKVFSRSYLLRCYISRMYVTDTLTIRRRQTTIGMLNSREDYPVSQRLLAFIFVLRKVIFYVWSVLVSPTLSDRSSSTVLYYSIFNLYL